MSLQDINLAALIEQIRVACRAMQPAPWDHQEPVLLVVTQAEEPGVCRVGDSRPSLGTKGCRFVMMHPVFVRLIKGELSKALDDMGRRGWPGMFLMQTMEARAIASNEDLARIFIWLHDQRTKLAGRRNDPVLLVPRGKPADVITAAALTEHKVEQQNQRLRRKT